MGEPAREREGGRDGDGQGVKGNLGGLLAENSFDNFPMHVCQTVVATLKTMCQSLMVDSHTVQDGGMEIVNMNRVFNDVVAVIIGLSVGQTTLDTTTGHPD